MGKEIAAIDSPTRAAGGARRATILIVEDSPVQAELLRRALEGVGYKVIAAGDGAEGLAMAKASRPDAVVSDINMPVMDGYAMCQAIRREESLKATPVILLTMLSDSEDVIHGLNAGADAYLTKPYNIPSLVARIASLQANPPVPPPATERRKLEVRLAGEARTVNAHGPRMLNLLISTYENAVLQNRELAATQQALEASSRDLARSNADLEQFAYVASHDLQEPLRMVVGYVQLMEKRLKDKLDTDTREFMGFAVDGALRMQKMIQDILAYSRVNTRGRPIEPADSAEALKEALALLESRIAETGAEVDAQSLPIVTADYAQLVQLFQNLVGNAIKFCKKHPPRVRIEACREARQWRFSVSDNGVGIPAEYRGQLFVIFRRLHTRREFPGTGIGLAICKRIVERHGGEVGIESAPGGGSVFWFTLPEEPSA